MLSLFKKFIQIICMVIVIGIVIILFIIWRVNRINDFLRAISDLQLQITVTLFILFVLLCCAYASDFYSKSLEKYSQKRQEKKPIIGLRLRTRHGSWKVIPANEQSNWSANERRRQAISKGMRKAAAKGQTLGRPLKEAEAILAEYPRVVELLGEGIGIREVSRLAGVARNTVRKVKEVMGS